MSKILIIEDELTLQNALKDRLTAEGFKVFQARDGIEGMQLATQDRPDLILLDIIMPKVNGLDVLKDLKNNIGLANVPVYILTNLAEDSSEKMTKDLGAEEYLIKSNLKIEELVAKITKRLRGN